MNQRVGVYRARLRALWEVDRLCQEREAAGFALISRDDRRPPLARSDFEQALRADPDGEENYLVHADWLQSQGDPIGQLIAVQHALAHSRRGSERHAELERQEMTMLFEHRRHLWGPLGDRIIDQNLQLYASELFAPVWHLGFLRSVEFNLFDLQLPAGLDIAHLARALFDLHIAKLLRGIAVQPLSGRTWPGLHELPGIIAELAPPTVTWLRFGRHNHHNQLPELHLGDHLPALTSLSLCASQLHFPSSLPKVLTEALEDLSLSTYRITDKLLAILTSASWPRLNSLSLRLHRFMSRAAEWHYPALGLGPLLLGDQAPSLRALTLHGTRDTDELIRQLSISPLANRLNHLDISFGALTSAGVNMLAERPFPNLRTLVAIENPISKDEARRLYYAAPEVEVHPLREEWDRDD